MSVILLLLVYLYAYQITIHYPQFCANYRATFRKVAAKLNLTLLEIPSFNNSQIILNNSKTIILYQWDIFETDIKYWLELFFYDKLPTLKIPIQELNQIQENLLIYYGNNQSYYSNLLQLSFNYPLYYIVHADPSRHQLDKIFFIQHYSIEENYLMIRRKQDHYDNVLLIKNQNEIDQFLETYGSPFQQEYLTMKQIKYLSLFPSSRAILYIDVNVYQHQQYKNIIHRQVDLYRQQKVKKNIFLVITEPIFMAKILLQRFMYKDIKQGPYLVYLEFNPFKFEIYQKDWQQYHIIQWISNHIDNQLASSKLQTLNQYLQTIPFSVLSGQNITTKTRNKVHSISIMEMFKKQSHPPELLIVRLIPYCYKSFIHFAKISQLETKSQILYSVNELIDGQEAILLTKNGSKTIDLNGDIGQQLNSI